MEQSNNNNNETERMVETSSSSSSSTSSPTSTSSIITKVMSFTVLPLLLSAYFILYTAKKPVFFHLHVIAMLFGYLTFVRSAIYYKKTVNSTITHGYLMFVAALLIAIGLVVAYVDKESRGKNHLVSYHAIIGFTSAFPLLLNPLISWLWFNPDNGSRRSDVKLRKLHRYSGNAILISGWIALLFGVYKYEKDPVIYGTICVLVLFFSSWNMYYK